MKYALLKYEIKSHFYGISQRDFTLDVLIKVSQNILSHIPSLGAALNKDSELRRFFKLCDFLQ